MAGSSSQERKPVWQQVLEEREALREEGDAFQKDISYAVAVSNIRNRGDHRLHPKNMIQSEGWVCMQVHVWNSE